MVWYEFEGQLKIQGQLLATHIMRTKVGEVGPMETSNAWALKVMDMLPYLCFPLIPKSGDA